MLLTALLLTGCGGTKTTEESSLLRFSDATSIETIRALDGKTVSITGYMATLSPISGKYMYLMNMPFQSCPFCVPNTTQLANTMAVYAPEGKTFDYTDQAVRITGKMELGDFTDDYGYVYNYRISDAACEIVNLGEISEKYALWQSIASDGIVADISTALDYVYFVCQWTEYSVSYTDDNGNDVFYYLYPGDAEQYLADDSAYGYAKFTGDDYFPGLIRRVNAISDTELTDLVQILTDARALEQYGLDQLSGGNYSYDEAADRYVLNEAEAMTARFDEIYSRFSQWLAGWEL